MKKIIIALVILLAVFLGGCASNELQDVNYEVYSEGNVVITTENESYSKNAKEIKYSIKNIGSEESFVNSDPYCFELHMLKDGEWKRVVTKTEHFWTEVALVMPAGHIEERKISLDEFYDLPLESGEYRIVVEQLASNTFEIK